MASSPNKVVFRPRAVDPMKRMPIRIFRGKCPSPSKIAASILPPSGMEKGEEKESHFQQAAFAQKASIAGVQVGNHKIPIPKVEIIDDDAYKALYPGAGKRDKKYVVFRGAVAFFLNEGVYDADSEDEEWLKTHDNIHIEEFEKIMERLENASRAEIIKPMDARALLQRFEEQIVDDVYDYWLQKRKNYIKHRRQASLIPKILTEPKPNEKALVNPYICFRRRFDKVQTRKKQKLEAEAYEKMLKLNNTVQKSITLIEMIKKREKTKAAILAFDESIFQKRYELLDSKNKVFDEINATVRPKFQVPAVPMKKGKIENGKTLTPLLLRPPSPSRKKRLISVTKVSPAINMFNDSNVVSDAWLRKNAEVWNRVGPTAAVPTTSAEEQLEAEKIAQFSMNSSVDGRYQFKRKRGCQYRAPITSEPSYTTSAEDGVLPIKYSNGPKKPEEMFDELDEHLYGPGFIPIHRRTSDKGKEEPLQAGVLQYLRAARGRIGRGSRLIFDLIVEKPQDPANSTQKECIPG